MTNRIKELHVDKQKSDEKIDPIMAAMLTPIKTRPVFAVGQIVRVLSRIDVNMPADLNYWLGAKCQVLTQVSRGLIRKDWTYLLKHSNGRTCEFMEYEIDGRYKRKSV